MKALLEEIDEALVTERQEVIDITPKSSSLGSGVLSWVIGYTVAFFVGWLVHKAFEKVFSAWDVELTKKQENQLKMVAQKALKSEVMERLEGLPDDSYFKVKGGGVSVELFWRCEERSFYRATDKIERELKSILGEEDPGMIRRMKLDSKVRKAFVRAAEKGKKKLAKMIRDKHHDLMAEHAAKAAREKGKDVSKEDLDPTKGRVDVYAEDRDVVVLFNCAYRF